MALPWDLIQEAPALRDFCRRTDGEFDLASATSLPRACRETLTSICANYSVGYAASGPAKIEIYCDAGVSHLGGESGAEGSAPVMIRPTLE